MRVNQAGNWAEIFRNFAAAFSSKNLIWRKVRTHFWWNTIILENGFLAVAATHHVINRAGIFHASFASHARSLLDRKKYVNTID